MIVLTFNGGLGNQLFQYAAGYAAACKKGTQLKLDLTGYGILGKDRRGVSGSDRHADILDFAIVAEVSEAEEVERVRRPRFGYLSKRLRQVKYKYLVNYYIDFHGGVLRPDAGEHMEGYFLTERYFASVASEVVPQFRLKDDAPIAAETQKIRGMGVPVSIHIRRGDFVSSEKNRRALDVCGSTYYAKAISEMRAMVGAFAPVVFSDDIGWVKANLGLGEAYFPGAGNRFTTAQELTLMSRCSHHIIPNSTFGWWGAYLNPSQSKVVIGPSIWTRGLPGYRQVIPPLWKRVPVDRS